MEKITSRENAKVKYACRLASSGAFRRAEGRFLAEGRKLCPELCRGAELETLFCTEAALEKCPELSGLPGEHYLVEDHVADKLADVGTHQGVFGVFRTPVHTLEEVKKGGRYLALERVQDPGNVGTLLRSAAALRYIAVPRGTFPDVRFGRTGRCGLRSSSKLRRSGFSSAATAGTIPISPTSHASFRIWMSPCSKTASTARIGAISTCFRPI